MGTFIDWLTARGLSEKAARWTAEFLLFLAILAFVAAVLALSRCTGARQERAQSRVETAQKGALTNSAADAVATTQNAAARERSSDALSETNEKEIRDAKGADAPVDPAVRDAGLRSLCRRAAYRDSPRCKLLEPASR